MLEETKMIPLQSMNKIYISETLIFGKHKKEMSMINL